VLEHSTVELEVREGCEVEALRATPGNRARARRAMFAELEVTGFHEAAPAMKSPPPSASCRSGTGRCVPTTAAPPGAWSVGGADERRRQWLPDLVVAAAGMIGEDASEGGEDGRATVASGRDRARHRHPPLAAGPPTARATQRGALCDRR
jgi:hypothetical protein